MTRSNENGIAMILALFMVLTMSILASSLMFVSQSETWSSMNYRLMSQARYGAEAGVNSAVNYLVKTYVAPSSVAELANYTTTVSPVIYNGNPVVLSSNAAQSNYPVTAVKTAFSTASQGSLNVNNGAVTYTATATLLSMNQFTDVYSGVPTTVQTWQVTGDGTTPGSRTSLVEVSAVVEQQITPVFSYAAFATNNGCDALSLGGGGSTDSYDSTGPLVSGLPVVALSGGNVGTNGNLDQVGASTHVYGSLSTPRSGVGNCTTSNVTAITISGGTQPTAGLVELPQPVTVPTPAAPSPLPPTTSFGITKTSGCSGVSNCTDNSGVGVTLTPGQFGNISVGANALVVLQPPAGGCNPCTFNINSLSVGGNAEIRIDPTMTGKVVFNFGGKDSSGNWLSTPIDFAGNSTLTANGYDASKFEMLYAGTGQIKLVGSTGAVGTVLAPNASGKFNGGTDFYGAVIVNTLTDMGGVDIHYDRNLAKSGQTAGARMMSTFTWKSY